MCNSSVLNVSDYCVSAKTPSVTVEVISCFLLVPCRPTTSSSFDPRGSSEQPTGLQQPHAAVTSHSHCNAKSLSLYKSNPSAGCSSQVTKCSVKSDVSKSLSREYSQLKSARKSLHKRRLSPYQHSGVKPGQGLPENDHPYSRRLKVKSKVSWV